MDVPRARAGSANDRARPRRARRRARRARRRLGDERARVGRAAVRAGEDRRDSGDRQHVAARARHRLPAAPERSGDAGDHPRLPRRRLRRRARQDWRDGGQDPDIEADHRRRRATATALAAVAGPSDPSPWSVTRTSPAMRRGPRDAPGRAWPGGRARHVINMQYTSGTTGFPKGVMLSSRNIVNNGFACGEVLGYTPDDRLCLCVPLFHCFGCVIGVMGAFTHGACLCVGGGVRSEARARDDAPRALHRALRRADDVHRGARASGLRQLRPDVAAHRRHGRRAVSRAADAACDDGHAPAGDHDRVRHDRSLAGHHHDAARRVGRAAIADGGHGAARSSRSRSSIRRAARSARSANAANCAAAATT